MKVEFLETKKKVRHRDPSLIGAVQVSLASPEVIRRHSFGEVVKPETINYRTFKPERGGLFCGAIFGPIRDFECICGRYKRKKFRGIVCERCGTPVIESSVRRERLGHINLASPVAHIWFLKSLPSRIGAVLDLTLKEVERVLYCESFIVLDSGKTELAFQELISEERYQSLLQEYGEGQFRVGIGAQAILELLSQVDVVDLARELREALPTLEVDTQIRRVLKRIKVVGGFLLGENRPEWMMLTVLPVLPPDLRPLVPLEGGRFATSDLNDLYRRVINRNNRLKRLQDLNAPDIIVRNERRMLQEAVDALLDNGRRGKTFNASNKRPLKSLSDMLKGKTGRFRQNLLGKRVDYSGRSVIVAGPYLKLHQCGLPKLMALELFKPFLFNRLEKAGFASTIKAAKRIVENPTAEVWDLLEEVTKEHPVLLNRAPTLHRLGIQAFEPILVEGKAIHLHPLVCQAFNADFDGDSMAVHVPLSVEAQIEARVLMMSSNNILSPQHGTPIIEPRKDMVLGLYYLTREEEYLEQPSSIFESYQSVRAAFDTGKVKLQTPIRFLKVAPTVDREAQIVFTTVGRVLLNRLVPIEVDFLNHYNCSLTQKKVWSLVNDTYRLCGPKRTVILCDALRAFSFHCATLSGVSISLSDMIVPKSKDDFVAQGAKDVQEVREQYSEGLITEGERRNRVIDIWTRVQEEIGEEMWQTISRQKRKTADGKEKEYPSENSIFMMADSGARGSPGQMRQLCGMRGLMAKATGEIIETPITANLREGLTALQYFINAYGARKGLADTALKTASAGYLTRQLVDVAQDVVISEEDCGSQEGVEVCHLIEGGQIVESAAQRCLGRILLQDVFNRETGELLAHSGDEVREDLVEQFNAGKVDKLLVRSVLTCRTRRGVCAKCYGRDLATGKLVDVGEAVGVIAAQSIGEPGTQLTMRTFHQGGAAQSSAQQSKFEAQVEGKVRIQSVKLSPERDGKRTVLGRYGELFLLDLEGQERDRFSIPFGADLFVEDGAKVQIGQLLVEWDPYALPILSEVSGEVFYEDLVDGVTVEESVDDVTGLTQRIILESRVGQYKPAIVVRDPEGEVVAISETRQARYVLPTGATLVAEPGSQVEAGDLLAKISREVTKTHDITGGLPRVNELFLAQKKSNFAIISEIDGHIYFGADHRGKRRIVVQPDVGDSREYFVPRGRHLVVVEGDFVRAGDLIVDGHPNPHDILKVMGEKALCQYLVEEIQAVYRLQGVSINDKHVEIIAKQMLRRVKVLDAGETHLLPGSQIDKWDFEEANLEAQKMGGQLATAEPLLLGIAKAASSTDSFISAASFQETTKVLTEAALASKVDHLRGLKENVIMGRRIPAGSGMDRYQNLRIRTVLN